LLSVEFGVPGFDSSTDKDMNENERIENFKTVSGQNGKTRTKNPTEKGWFSRGVFFPAFQRHLSTLV
jgi:hypothetical protein